MVKETYNFQNGLKNSKNKLPLLREVGGLLIWCGVGTIVFSHCHQALWTM
jgi:hypothetical protein